MLVAVHNPAQVALLFPKIAVPHGNYDVSTYNHESGLFEFANSTALCDNYQLQNGKRIESCDLYISYFINESSLGYIQISYNPLTDVRAKKFSDGVPTIDNDFETLTFVEYFSSVGAMFRLYKKEYFKTFTFAFDLRFWPSFETSG